MLIVIVIIGILAAALIPRLSNARGRATDVAVKAEMQQLSTSLAAYLNDNGNFSGVAWGKITSTSFASLLSGGQLNSIPKTTDYYFSALTKWGVTSGWFMLTGKVTSMSSANWTTTWSSQTTSEAQATTWALCTSFVSSGQDSVAPFAGACSIKSDGTTAVYMTVN